MVNVGSVGQPRDGDPRACYVMLTDDQIEFRRVAYPVEKTIEKIYADPRARSRSWATGCRKGGSPPWRLAGLWDDLGSSAGPRRALEGHRLQCRTGPRTAFGCREPTADACDAQHERDEQSIDGVFHGMNVCDGWSRMW